jgi:dihydroflavonol-4-reductase
MKVLLTGATGLVGGAVARELVARGHAVRALAREGSDASALGALGIEVARGDVLDAAAVRRALAGQDAVVHVAGIATIGQEPPERLMAVNAGGVETVLGAALEAGVARAVLTSSTSVMGGTRRPELRDETTPGNAEALGIPYFVSKLRGERAGLALAARGLPLVVLRPSYVLGPGDVHGGSPSTVLALARRRIPAMVDGGASFCDVRDVAHGHAEALERGRAGEVYVLGGHNRPVAELAAHVSALTGVRAPPRVPYAAAYAFAAAQELGARLAGRRPAVTRDLVRSAALYTYVSSAKAERELGYAVRPFDEMISDTLRDAIARGRLRAETSALRALAG